jgi:CheY-like chemotaxis protein
MASSVPRILAVEDNAETRLLLDHLLQSSFEAQVVDGVDPALEAAADHRFDVVLLDINLSEERTGTDLLQLLREHEHLTQVPAIALTAYAMPGDREDFLDSGFNAYISKPFARDELERVIQNVLTDAPSDA